MNTAFAKTATAIAALFAIAAAAVWFWQGEIIYPNSAEGPMDRPPPPDAAQHWLVNTDSFF